MEALFWIIAVVVICMGGLWFFYNWFRYHPLARRSASLKDALRNCKDEGRQYEISERATNVTFELAGWKRQQQGAFGLLIFGILFLLLALVLSST